MLCISVEGGVMQIKTYVLLGGGSQKRTRAYKGGKKVTFLSVSTFWMTPFYPPANERQTKTILLFNAGYMIHSNGYFALFLYGPSL